MLKGCIKKLLFLAIALSCAIGMQVRAEGTLADVFSHAEESGWIYFDTTVGAEISPRSDLSYSITRFRFTFFWWTNNPRILYLDMGFYHSRSQGIAEISRVRPMYAGGNWIGTGFELTDLEYSRPHLHFIVFCPVANQEYSITITPHPNGTTSHNINITNW
jgi:hypothetical protein